MPAELPAASHIVTPGRFNGDPVRYCPASNRAASWNRIDPRLFVARRAAMDGASSRAKATKKRLLDGLFKRPRYRTSRLLLWPVTRS